MNQNQSRSFFRTPGGIIVILIGAGMAMCGACGVLAVIGAHSPGALSLAPTATPSSDSRTTASDSTEGAQNTPTATPKPDYIKDSCAKVSRTFGSASTLSSIQQDELWKGYEDRAFSWRLELVEVQSGLVDGFSVTWKCADNSPSLLFDVTMEYPEEAKGELLKLQKGDVYKVQGRLKRFGQLLGLDAEPM